MKKIISVFIFTAVLISLIACADKTTDKYYNDEMRVYESFSGTEYQDIKENSAEYVISACDALALVEVVEVKPYFYEQAECKARVINDYFNNINYEGMEEGYITYFEWEEAENKAGDIRLLAMSSSVDYVFPYVVYVPSYFNVLSDKDGNIQAEKIKAKVYGAEIDLKSETVSSAIACAAETEFKAEIKGLERPSSFEDAMRIADTALEIKIINIKENGVTDYFYSIEFSVINNGGNDKYNTEEYYVESITTKNVCETGERYALFLKDGSAVGDYALMPYSEYENLR